MCHCYCDKPNKDKLSTRGTHEACISERVVLYTKLSSARPWTKGGVKFSNKINDAKCIKM